MALRARRGEAAGRPLKTPIEGRRDGPGRGTYVLRPGGGPGHHHSFEEEHRGLSLFFLALAPALGVVGWSFLGLSQATLFMAPALVAGSTVVQIIQTELPSPDLVRIGPFFLGASVYMAMVAARWASAS